MPSATKTGVTEHRRVAERRTRMITQEPVDRQTTPGTSSALWPRISNWTMLSTNEACWSARCPGDEPSGRNTVVGCPSESIRAVARPWRRTLRGPRPGRLEHHRPAAAGQLRERRRPTVARRARATGPARVRAGLRKTSASARRAARGMIERVSCSLGRWWCRTLGVLQGCVKLTARYDCICLNGYYSPVVENDHQVKTAWLHVLFPPTRSDQM